jgi:hypothetical protein
MKKKTMLIWIFVSNFLMLIFLVLQYFGLTRYISLHCSKCEPYIKTYSSLPVNKVKGQRVVISFSATPENIEKINPMILSLMDQTIKVDEISLNLYGKLDYKIPDKYKDMINIYKCGKDYKEMMKLVPTLLREYEKNTIIIYLDEMVVYGKDFIEKLVEESTINPDKIIETRYAVLIKPDFVDKNIVSEISGTFSYTKPVHKVNYFENYKLLY